MLSAITRAVSQIDCELEIVKMELEHPLLFVKTDNSPISNVLWVTKGAKSKMLELVSGLFRLGELTTRNGMELRYADIARGIELAFNANLGNLYVKRNQCRNRKKSAAPFLHRLAALVEQDADSIL